MNDESERRDLVIRPAGKRGQEGEEEAKERDDDNDTTTTWIGVEQVPLYLRQAISESPLPNRSSKTSGQVRVRVLDLGEIGELKEQERQTELLLLRHHVTQTMGGRNGLLRPELMLKRARCHEALGYDELAVGDAYAAFVLASGESEDLVEKTVVSTEEDGEEQEWDVEGRVAGEVRVGSLRVLVRGLRRLGAVGEVGTWETVLRQEAEGKEEEDNSWWVLDQAGQKHEEQEEEDQDRQGLEGIFGRCQRVVYPWNSHEPDRMSAESLAEINERLADASDGILECRKTVLPSLSISTTTTENAQLGLFTTRRAGPSTALLRERSCLTAIRPHDAALCDCCAADLEADSVGDERVESSAPFCAGPAGCETPFTDLGRAESSTTPEWDLYFLLVVRCIQMAITQDVHPLDLFEVKYLWGGFSSAGGGNEEKPSLPFSFHHHISLPFQLFENVLLSIPELHPYSSTWLDRFDFWTINTLYAKFRGVATASQSSFDGKAETAAVHALWCLANHSCAPNVGWETGGGMRVLRVQEEDEVDEGGEVWNHYTDVRETDVRVRRARLREVLGGECMCKRCVSEAGERGERGD
ncbi:hypothetical protein DV738_g3040, partial [Chaetothyriales sp. CBS 135597]